MAEMQTGYIEQSDGRLYYEVAGDGDTLVLGHAGFVDRGMWAPQWDAFAGRYRVIRYDMRGFGKSDPAPAPRNRRADLRQLLEHLQVERAALVGCSMSGTIMLDFALEHPEMVSALVIVSSAPSGYQPEGDPPPELMEMFPAAKQGDTARVSELQMRLWIDGPTRQPDQVNPDVRRRALEMNRIPVERSTFFIADLQPVEPLDPPAVSRLGSVQAPTLILAGALDYPTTVLAADIMAEGIPGAQKHIFAHSAHLPNMEQPEEFTRVTLEFLSKAE
ncbi:MAG TPA: alpha/beta hydrolase [Ktedonobacterales bacterium]|nr:alpha/beta hydrolase [Ktedonobacterales bacterium]